VNDPLLSLSKALLWVAESQVWNYTCHILLLLVGITLTYYIKYQLNGSTVEQPDTKSYWQVHQKRRSVWAAMWRSLETKKLSF
jgi:hypothetical protein